MHAAGGRQKDVLWEIVEKVYTGYSGLMRTHMTSYRSRVNVLFADAPSKVSMSGVIAFVLARTVTRYVSVRPPVTRSRVTAHLLEMMLMKTLLG